MTTATITKTCLHCGTPFRPSAQRTDFCCGGCQFVNELIVRNGLGQFYELQDGALPPASSTVFQPRNYDWLVELAAQNQGKPLTVDLQGLSCVGCVWLIERLFQRRPGALSIRIDSSLGRMTLIVGTEFDFAEFARELQNFGYLVGPTSGNAKPASKGLVLRLGICAALAMNAMLFTLPSYLGMQPQAEFSSLFALLAFVCGTLSFAIGGSYFIRRAWFGLRQGMLHIDLPISLGLIAAWSGSVVGWTTHRASFVYFDFVSMFTFLMLTGRWLQQKAVEANRTRLLASQPDLLRPEVGERFQLAPGGTLPVRSILVSPTASLSLEWINGEAEAQAVTAGQSMVAGAINLTSATIECEALESWSQSMLSRLVGEHRHSPAGDALLERFLRNYIGIVLTLAVGAFLGWYFGSGDLLRALQVLTSILVVSCPCAAGVAIPLADELAAAIIRRSGVFAREQTLWTRILRLRRIVFDKTGTLTLQGRQLLSPEALQQLSGEERSVLLAMVRTNLHPAASALREALMAMGVMPAALEAEPEEVVGCGIAAQYQGETWKLGRAGWVGDAGDAECVLVRAGGKLAEFRFADTIREDAVESIRWFQRRGYEVAILSGDRPAKVLRMAEALGLPEAAALGGLTPEAKAAWLRVNDGAHALMIGDGANDSLAFNEALCTGTPVIDRGLLEHKSDFYFLGRGLAGLRRLFETADLRRVATHRVVTFAIIYNACAVLLSTAGAMNPLAAAVLMPASSLITIGLVLWTLRRRS